MYNSVVNYAILYSKKWVKKGILTYTGLTENKSSHRDNEGIWIDFMNMLRAILTHIPYIHCLQCGCTYITIAKDMQELTVHYDTELLTVLCTHGPSICNKSFSN